MSLLFLDGFDHYTTAQATRKYSFSNWSIASNGRNGAGSGFLNATNQTGRIAVPAGTTFIVGGAVKPSPGGELRAFSLYESTTSHITITRLINGRVSADRGGSFPGTGSANHIAATSGPVMPPDTFSWIEAKINIHDTTGSVVVKVNGVTVINETNVDTRNAGSSGNVDEIRIAGAGTWDCLYVCDTVTDPPRDDFMGDFIVDTLFPDGAGNSSQFTPSVGSNWQNVDETDADDDTTFNDSSAVNNIDLYTFGNVSTITGGATPLGVQVTATVEAEPDGSKNFQHKARVAATNYTGASGSTALTNDYTMHREIWGENPNIVDEWTDTTINGAEFGLEAL
jgi:hypothetical protein